MDRTMKEQRSAPLSTRVSQRVGGILALLACLAFATAAPAQDWFKTGTGLGVAKPRVAVADFASKTAASGSFATLFSNVVRSDLDFSGILELVSKSFYPTESPSVPAELNGASWTEAPALAQFLAFGNLTAEGNDLAIQAWFQDLRNPSAPPIIGQVYRGAVSEPVVRQFAHQFADEIIARLSGGVAGIATTKLTFVSGRNGNKEIWVMDYDGANQRQLTSLRSIALTPRWSPDGSRIAFTCYPTAGAVLSAQICMYSMLTEKLVTWPRFRGTNSSPAWSPDGSKIMFMSSMYGNPELYTADADGGHVQRTTHSVGASTSPSWNPKTGQQVAFVSDRGGLPQLYTMDAQGGDVVKLPLPDMGYVIDPAWSPNGQLLAFSWRRPDGNYDLYLMEMASHQLVELTRDAGRNERPSWAPDGRHIVFESTRTGTRQIWSMLADGTNPRQLTTEGQNESPNWSVSQSR
jgi:TolB protein